MTFKNRRGEVPWYVIGLILAIIVLLVSLGAIFKIRAAQQQTTNAANACSVLGGACGTCEDTKIVLGAASCKAPTPDCCPVS